MTGQKYWPDSTGKGLESLARRGQQKLDAFNRQEVLQNADANSSALNVVNNTSNNTPLRSPAEQNAITGDIFYAASTGKETAPLAKQVKARELSALQRRSARHGPVRSGEKPWMAGERKPGAIYITGHQVGLIGPLHTAIEYRSESKGQTTFSAGPDKEKGEYWENGYLGNLKAEEGRKGDEPENNKTLAIVTPPKGMSADEHFEILKDANASYQNDVDYDLFPALGDSHNSNSFTRGLLDATGGSANINWYAYVGGSDPLPVKHFRRRSK